MSADRFFTKERYIWQIGALRLLREKACAQYARLHVPHIVDGIQIEFPSVEISLGFRVSVKTRYLEGQSLLSMLYDRQLPRAVAVSAGITALKALHSADVKSAAFSIFGLIFRSIRGPRVFLGEMLGSTVLSPGQRRELQRLIARSAADRGSRNVLVHGDLHASHVIVNLADKSLGLIDLEAMHIGKAATNFAHLWLGFHYVDPLFGQQFYRLYAEQCPDLVDQYFDTDVRAEIALKSYSHISAGRRSGNRDLETKARALLADVLSGASFEGVCSGEGLHGNTEGVH